MLYQKYLVILMFYSREEDVKKLNKSRWIFWPIYEDVKYIDSVIESDELGYKYDGFTWERSIYKKDGNDHIDRHRYIRIDENGNKNYRNVTVRHIFKVKRSIKLW